MAKSLDVYIEKGQKKVFAGAIEWPGWCRSGKDEAAALQALLSYGPRYQQAINGSGQKFEAPEELSQLRIVERLKGDATTDFGAPGKAPTADGRRIAAADIQRLKGILAACWGAFDAAAAAAKGKRLRTGPRGGGRNLAGILEHVAGAQEGYLGALGWWASPGQTKPREIDMLAVRAEALKGMDASAAGVIPATGPRGGKRWSARYFVRRAAWHILDHAWEIEDRIE